MRKTPFFAMIQKCDGQPLIDTIQVDRFLPIRLPHGKRRGFFVIPRAAFEHLLRRPDNELQ